MENLSENNLVRFVSISRKKEGIFAIFKVKGVRGGTYFTATITVDLAAAEVDISSDSLEAIIEQCAPIAVREFQKADLQFEGLQAV